MYETSDEAAVSTLAELIYECGFSPEKSIDMAWFLATASADWNDRKEF